MQMIEKTDAGIAAKTRRQKSSRASGTQITPAERRVLEALAPDPFAPQKLVARTAGLSVRTVEVHLRSLRAKLRETRTPKLIAAWRRQSQFGTLDPEAAELIARAERAMSEIVMSLIVVGEVASIEIDRASGAPRARIYVQPTEARGDGH